jgi:hypothetical protein
MRESDRRVRQACGLKEKGSLVIDIGGAWKPERTGIEPIAIPEFKNFVWNKLERISVAVKFGRSL